MLIEHFNGEEIMNVGCLPQWQHSRSPRRVQTLLRMEMMELVELPGLGGDGRLERHAQQQHEGTRQGRETYSKRTPAT